MSGYVSRFRDIIAHELARTNVSYYKHRSALRGTPGSAWCLAPKLKVMKPKPRELPDRNAVIICRGPESCLIATPSLFAADEGKGGGGGGSKRASTQRHGAAPPRAARRWMPLHASAFYPNATVPFHQGETAGLSTSSMSSGQNRCARTRLDGARLMKS